MYQPVMPAPAPAPQMQAPASATPQMQPPAPSAPMAAPGMLTPHFQSGPTPPAPPMTTPAPAPQVQPLPGQPNQPMSGQPAQMQPPPFMQPPQQTQQPVQAQAPQVPQTPQQPAQPFFSSFDTPAQAQSPAAMDPTSFAQQVAQQLAAAQQQPQDQFALQVPEADTTALDPYDAALERKFVEMANRHLAPQLGRVAEQVQQTQGIRSDIQQLQRSSYENSIRAAVPDLDSVASTPEFQQYRNTVLPGGVTVDSLVRSAHQNMNAAAIIDVFRGFAQSQTTQQPQTQPQLSSNGFSGQAQQFAQPHVAPGAALYPAAGQQPAVTEAYAADVLNRYARGQASREEYMAVEAALQNNQVGR